MMQINILEVVNKQEIESYESYRVLRIFNSMYLDIFQNLKKEMSWVWSIALTSGFIEEDQVHRSNTLSLNYTNASCTDTRETQEDLFCFRNDKKERLCWEKHQKYMF